MQTRTETTTGEMDMQVTVKSPKNTVFVIDLANSTLTAKTAGIVNQPIVSYTTVSYDGDNVYCPVIERNGQKQPIVVRSGDDDLLYKAKKQYEADKSEQAVPGLAELESAIFAAERYADQFAAMMDDEMNDGVRPPAQPGCDIDALKAQYPRAAVYITADSYCNASHYAKASAGRKAKELLLSGGSLEQAKKILSNWASNVTID